LTVHSTNGFGKCRQATVAAYPVPSHFERIPINNHTSKNFYHSASSPSALADALQTLPIWACLCYGAWNINRKLHEELAGYQNWRVKGSGNPEGHKDPPSPGWTLHVEL
jgi:hypothetical protein